MSESTDRLHPARWTPDTLQLLEITIRRESLKLPAHVAKEFDRDGDEPLSVTVTKDREVTRPLWANPDLRGEFITVHSDISLSCQAVCVQDPDSGIRLVLALLCVFRGSEILDHPKLSLDYDETTTEWTPPAAYVPAASTDCSEPTSPLICVICAKRKRGVFEKACGCLVSLAQMYFKTHPEENKVTAAVFCCYAQDVAVLWGELDNEVVHLVKGKKLGYEFVRTSWMKCDARAHRRELWEQVKCMVRTTTVKKSS